MAVRRVPCALLAFSRGTLRGRALHNVRCLTDPLSVALHSRPDGAQKKRKSSPFELMEEELGMLGDDTLGRSRTPLRHAHVPILHPRCTVVVNTLACRNGVKTEQAW